MGTKRKRSGSLGLAEPFHRNFTEYTKLYTFFTQKIGFWKFIRWLRNCSRGIGGLPGRLQQKTGCDRSQPVVRSFRGSNQLLRKWSICSDSMPYSRDPFPARFSISLSCS